MKRFYSILSIRLGKGERSRKFLPMVLLSAMLPLLLVLMVVTGVQVAQGAPSSISMAGVHWYSGDTNMIDMNVPWGQRGWNVEAIYGVKDLGAKDHAHYKAQKAKDDGLVNIIRIDYQGGKAVPTNSSEFEEWKNDFTARVNDMWDVAQIFIVGNEPNIEGNINPQQYADAFNFLYEEKDEMPNGTKLLVAGPSGFSDPYWLRQVTSLINDTDGFAIHTYGDPSYPGCEDPRQPCSRGGWYFDGGFLYFEDLIDQFAGRFPSKPVYITEFNTDVNGRDADPNPIDNYKADWIDNAFEAVRSYNDNRGNGPEVKALCWFVDRDDGDWGDYALRNISDALQDMKEEFHNPANRGEAPPIDPSTALESGWEDGQVHGRVDSIKYSRNVAGYFNTWSPPPECSRRYHETVRSGNYSLMIAGYSQASYAYCYYRVFDEHIPVVEGMKISYWIYHKVGTPKISVDGHFTDGATIRDFGGGILIDQHGIRIHPGYRQDPMNQWYYVEVDLSAAAGKTIDFIMFAFDNGGDGFRGQYRAHVDGFRIFTEGSGFPSSITGGLPKGAFGSGSQTDEVTEPETWRWSELFYGHQGIDMIDWQSDACGGWHNYAMGWHQGDLVEYLMKFGGDYSRLVLRGIADRPGPVELEIYIDGQYKARAAWDNNNDCNQDVAVDIDGISYDTHAIAVKFVNDYNNPSMGDRNFYLDGLKVERSSGPPPPPPPPPPANKSKLTIHTSFLGGESMLFIEQAQPTVIKILNNFGPAQQVKEKSPHTKIVGRIWYDDRQRLGVGSPEDRAQDWWNDLRDTILAHPAVDYWEGYNEPVINDAGLMGWYARFEKKRVDILAEHGLSACIGNFSTGMPPVERDLWEAFYPAIDAAKSKGGVLGLHEYSAPDLDWLFDYGSGEGWLTGRYLKVYRQFLTPSGREIPLVITECGIDAGVGVGDGRCTNPPCGWKTYQSAEDYFDQLKWYDSILKEDSYVLGATIFCLEIYGWEDFDIRGRVRELLTDYVGSSGQ